MSSPGTDLRIGEVAARQKGLVTARQLAELGLARASISHRTKVGRLHRLHRGVYAVGHLALSEEARLLAAVLACGSGALLSHTSAGATWKLLGEDRGPVHVTTPGRRSRPRPGIRTHQSTALTRADARVRRGIPITSPTATILDIATINESLAEHALNEALLHKLTSAGEVEAIVERRTGHPGLGVLIKLANKMNGNDFSRSHAEKLLWEMILSAGLPRPRRNVPVHGSELDFYWPDLRLNIEIDGYRWHSTKARMERDRVRDATLTARGTRVLRLTFSQLQRRDQVIALVAAAISEARSSNLRT